MNLVRRVSPQFEFVSLRQAMDRLFEDSSVHPHGPAVGSVAGSAGANA